MFEAELAHKLPELRAREDYLTSCIFGVIKHLPPSEVLFPLLNSSFNHRLNTSLGSYLKSLDIDLNRFDKVQFYFWPRSSEYGEPDLVIILEGISSSFIIPIEIKYFSGKHGEEEKDQLMRYYIALLTVDGRKTFGQEAIRKFSGDLLAFIYLTKFEAQPDIEETIRIIELKGISDAPNKIFHLRWQEISKLIESILSKEQDSYKKAVYYDIWKLMEFKNLLPFKHFSILPRGLSAELLAKHPIFLSTLFIGFPASPKNLRLEYGANIFYGG